MPDRGGWSWRGPGPGHSAENRGPGPAGEVPPAAPPGRFRAPPRARLHPAVPLQDGASGLTPVLSGPTHVLCHPAHGADQGGQRGTGHLAANEALQLGAPRLRPPGGPGLQVVDLGFERLRQRKRGVGARWRGGGKGEVKGAPRASRPTAPRLPQPETQARALLGGVHGREPGSCLVCLAAAVTVPPSTQCSRGAVCASLGHIRRPPVSQKVPPSPACWPHRAHWPHPRLRETLEPTVARSGGLDPLQARMRAPGLAGRSTAPRSLRPETG